MSEIVQEYTDHQNVIMQWEFKPHLGTASHIAEMIIEGSTMGITDQTRILHELDRTDPEGDPNYGAVRDLAAEIVGFEEAQIEKMKAYL